MKVLKIAVIGCGGISGAHIEAYMRHPEAEVYALCDINEARLKAYGEKYGITRLFTDYNDMFRMLPELDAVSVCTWNNTHAPITIAALEAGKDVLCEKPMSLNAEIADQMKKTAERTGRKLMLGFVRRCGRDCIYAKDFINKGALGDVYYAQAKILRRNGNPGGWFADKAYSGGGPLIDLGVHVIDMVRYLIGNPKPVAVTAISVDALKTSRATTKDVVEYASLSAGDRDFKNDVEDFAAAFIRFDNGAILNVETSYALEMEKDECYIALYGTKGGIKIDPNLHLYMQMYDYPVNIDIAMPTDFSFEGFNNEIDSFIKYIKGERDCLSPATDGVELMKILDAVYESARIKREVIIK